MGKYSNANVLQIKIDEDHKQKRLKDKHKIENENVVIVEKNNLFKFSVRLIILIIKTIFCISLFCMAAIGIFTLIYSDLRQSFISILTQIINSILGGF